MTQTPVTQVVTEETAVLKEDWHFVLAVWAANAIGSVGTGLFVFPLALLGMFLIGGVGSALSAWVSGGMLIGFVTGMMALVLILSFVGTAINAFIRGGIVSVLRTRKAGMKTSFETFVQHAKAGFRPAFRIMLPLWLGVVLVFVLFVGGLLTVFALAVAASGGWQGAEGEEILAGMFVLILALFPFIAVVFFALLAAQIVTGYALYAAFEDPSRTTQENYRISFIFVRQQFGATIGLHALFWVLSLAATTVLQTVFTPLLILSYIPFIGIIFSIPTGILMTAASLLLSSGLAVWMEVANLRFFRERRLQTREKLAKQ